jgi:hypothetical protein
LKNLLGNRDPIWIESIVDVCKYKRLEAAVDRFSNRHSPDPGDGA